MKTTSLKNKIVVALLLVIAGHAGIASALSMVGSKTKIRMTGSITPSPPPPPPGTSDFSHSGALTDPAWATDVWTVVCPETTERLETQVIDLNPEETPLVSVQAINIKGGKENATNSTDPGDGDEAYSPLVSITGSAGTYYVLIDKTSARPEIYTVNIVCKNSANAALAGTSATLTQDN